MPSQNGSPKPAISQNRHAWWSLCPDLSRSSFCLDSPPKIAHECPSASRPTQCWSLQLYLHQPCGSPRLLFGYKTYGYDSLVQFTSSWVTFLFSSVKLHVFSSVKLHESEVSAASEKQNLGGLRHVSARSCNSLCQWAYHSNKQWQS